MRRFLTLLLTLAALAIPVGADSDLSPFELEADLTNKMIHALVDGERIRSWSIAVGTKHHPTPVGDFSIRKMIWNPGWVPPRKDWAKDASAKRPGDPDSPMRIVKIFFKQPDYYIHGTNKPETLGTAASHGCIRMSENDVFELGKMIMDYSGESQPASWFRRILTSDTSNTIYLGQRVSLRIAEELDP